MVPDGSLPCPQERVFNRTRTLHFVEILWMLFTLLCPGCRNCLIHSDFPVTVLCILSFSPITCNMYRPFNFWFLKFRLCVGNNIFPCFSYFLSPSGVFESSESLYYFRIDGNKNIRWPFRKQCDEELMIAYGKCDLRSPPLFVSVISHPHFYFRTRKLN
jgi:hypothetical protein